MGFLDKLFKKKEPERPPGEGEGPDFVAPPDNPPIPYVIANPTYAQPPQTKLAYEELSRGHEYKVTDGPPEKWTKNNPLQETELWPQEHLVGEEGQPNNVPRKTRAADPRWNPPTYTGATGMGSRNPRGYEFQRPFDVSSAKYLNGNRFSQAEHPTAYPYTGITTAGFKRNTYRLDPAPWDSEIVDRPTGDQIPETSSATYVQPIEVPRGRNSYRLGG